MPIVSKFLYKSHKYEDLEYLNKTLMWLAMRAVGWYKSNTTQSWRSCRKIVQLLQRAVQADRWRNVALLPFLNRTHPWHEEWPLVLTIHEMYISSILVCSVVWWAIYRSSWKVSNLDWTWTPNFEVNAIYNVDNVKSLQTCFSKTIVLLSKPVNKTKV